MKYSKVRTYCVEVIDRETNEVLEYLYPRDYVEATMLYHEYFTEDTVAKLIENEW